MKNLLNRSAEKFKHAKRARRRVLCILTAAAVAASCCAFRQPGEDGEEMGGLSDPLKYDEETTVLPGEEETSAGDTEEDPSELPPLPADDPAVPPSDAAALTAPSEEEDYNIRYNGTGEANAALDSRSGGAGYGDRDFIYGLEKYADGDGNIRITLPDNAHLGGDFVVYRDEDTGEEITVNASRVSGSNNFLWKVVGWYNIAADSYIDVSEGPAETTINIADGSENVFYADLEAATYDNGSAYDNGVIESAMTGDFVTVKLFDYNELFNLYSCSVSQNGILSESWDAGYPDKGARLYEVPVLNRIESLYADNRYITKSFLFTGTSWGSGNLVSPENKNYWNEWTGDSPAEDENKKPIKYQLIPGSNWDMTSPDSRIFRMLFDETGDTYGVHYIGEADGLFQYGTEGDELHVEDGNEANTLDYDFNGYYYYTSAQNGASYNRSEGRFYLYDEPEEYQNDKARYTMFLPFNAHKSSLYGAGEIDYWFGMEMEVNFYLPGDTGATDGDEYVNLVNEDQHMIFNFSGDDDIYVFVDDELVLDMGGIHDEAVGWIDFATGEYYYHCLDQTSGTGGGDNITGSLSLHSGVHRLTVYYMERGCGASNLTVSFNIMPKWHYYTDETTTVTAKKEWSDGYENHAGESVLFGLFEEIPDTGYSCSISVDGSSETYTVTVNGSEEKDYVFRNGSTRACDEEGKVIAMLEDEEGTGERRLYVLVAETPPGISGEQELSEANDWTFAWELLENDRDYRVLELDIPAGYTVTSSSSSFGTWSYWSIIGESELEEMYREHLEDGDAEYWVILTDAAAGWDGSAGGLPVGKVIRNNIASGTVDVHFSEAPAWSVPNVYSVEAEFGDIADSEIKKLSDNGSRVFVKWKVIFTGNYSTDDDHMDADHTFYLFSENGSQYIYVTTVDGVKTLRRTSNIDNAAAFYVDSLGELRVDGTGERVVFDGDIRLAGISEEPESGTANKNIRVYTLSEIPTYGTAFTFLNSASDPLPNTGGPGTVPYAAGGAALAAAAGSCMIYRRRKGGER